MKHYILFILFFVFCNPIKASAIDLIPITLTVEQAYNIFKSKRKNFDEQSKYYTMIGYHTAIIDHEAVRSAKKSKKASQCIYRSLGVWYHTIFDAYERNEIKGSEQFYSIFIRTIEKNCNVKLIPRK